MESLGIEGVRLFTPHIIRDDRGEFLEWFRGGEFESDTGYPMPLAQANCSVSRRGVLRGLHFADAPPGQAKYVMCTSGAVLDVVADVRRGSPTYGRWVSARLDTERRQSLYVAEGLAHGVLALTDDAMIVYFCSEPYRAGAERGIDPLDPAIGVEWPDDVDIRLSEKDAKAPTLRQAEAAGILPDYAECRRAGTTPGTTGGGDSASSVT